MNSLRFYLTRFAYDYDTTWGALSYSPPDMTLRIPICFTVENPWKDNKVNISCIPKGLYKLEVKPSTKVSLQDNRALWVQDVIHRTVIVIHPGNTHLDTLGCILPVTSIGRVNGILGGLHSKNAFEDIMNIVYLFPDTDKYLIIQ